MTYPLSNARRFAPPLFAVHYARRSTLDFGAISQLPICKEGAGYKPALPDYSPLLRHFREPVGQARILLLPGERAGVRGNSHRFSHFPRARQFCAKVFLRLRAKQTRRILFE